MSQADGHVHGAADAAALDRRQHRHAGLIEAGERVLQVADMFAQGFAANGVIHGGGRDHAGAVGEDGEVHAGREMLAGRGDDDAAGARVVVDVGNDGRQLVPEGAVHGVEFVGPVQLDVRDMIGDLDIEAGGGSGHWRSSPVAFEW